jgi:hypothetical protein
MAFTTVVIFAEAQLCWSLISATIPNLKNFIKSFNTGFGHESGFSTLGGSGYRSGYPSGSNSNQNSSNTREAMKREAIRAEAIRMAKIERNSERNSERTRERNGERNGYRNSGRSSGGNSARELRELEEARRRQDDRFAGMRMEHDYEIAVYGGLSRPESRSIGSNRSEEWIIRKDVVMTVRS